MMEIAKKAPIENKIIATERRVFPVILNLLSLFGFPHAAPCWLKENIVRDKIDAISPKRRKSNGHFINGATVFRSAPADTNTGNKPIRARMAPAFINVR